MKDHLLGLLIERAMSARDAQIANARSAQEQRDQSQQTLARLERFQLDFLQRAPGPQQPAMDVARLDERQKFADALSHVVTIQQDVHHQNAAAEKLAREQLLEKQRRLLALQVLNRRQRETALRAQLRKEQQDSDAWAARQHLKNREASR